MINRQSTFSNATIQSLQIQNAFVTITLILLYANALQCSVSPCHAFSTRSTIVYPLRHSLRQPRRSPHIPKTSYSTTLSLSFQEPASDNDSAPQSKENLDPKFQQRSKSWIVLVDDEESIRLAIGNYLYDAGYAVTACSDAEALLELLTTASTCMVPPGEQRIVTGSGNHEMPTKLPSVIICDIRMPGGGMDGLDLLDILKNSDSTRFSTMSETSSSPSASTSTTSDLDFIRKEWSRIPVILLTAKSLTQDRIQGYRKGADVYLAKPFAPEELLSIVDNLIKRMQALNNRSVNSNKSGNRGVIRETDGGENGERYLDTERKTLRDAKSDIIEIKALLKSEAGANAVTRGPRRKQLPSAPTQRSSAIVPRNGPNGRPSASTVSQSDIEEFQSNVKLTEAEEKILKLLGEGRTNKEIAALRGVSTVRVSRTVSNLYYKTLTKTRTELVRWAIKMGYISAR